MTQYIWIVRWGDFQHYRPSRERGPAWIKAYTAQLSDERYLNLTDRQRALLWDLRMVFATMRGRVPYDAPTTSRQTSDDAPTTLRRRSDGSRMITRQRCSQTRHEDMEALNEAGFIEFLSRESLELTLEMFYSRSRKKSREEDVEENTPTSSVSELLPSSNVTPLPEDASGDIDFATPNGEPERWNTDIDIHTLANVIEEGRRT